MSPWIFWPVAGVALGLAFLLGSAAGALIAWRRVREWLAAQNIAAVDCPRCGSRIRVKAKDA
jgi:hypothetical protein